MSNIPISNEAREAASEENRRVWIGNPQPDFQCGHFVQLAINSATERLQQENAKLMSEKAGLVESLGNTMQRLHEENQKLREEVKRLDDAIRLAAASRIFAREESIQEENRKLKEELNLRGGDLNTISKQQNEIFSLQKTIAGLREALETVKNADDKAIQELSLLGVSNDIDRTVIKVVNEALSSTPQDFSKMFVRREIVERLVENAQRTGDLKVALTLAKQELEEK